MAAIEFRQARDQPVHCKGGRDPNREHRTRPHRRNLIRKSLERAECIGQSRLERTALIGELQSIGVTPEEREAKSLFEQPHLLAHGRLRDVQVLRRQRETSVARRGLERAQSVQKQRSPGHGLAPRFPCAHH